MYYLLLNTGPQQCDIDRKGHWWGLSCWKTSKQTHQAGVEILVGLQSNMSQKVENQGRTCYQVCSNICILCMCSYACSAGPDDIDTTLLTRRYWHDDNGTMLLTRRYYLYRADVTLLFSMLLTRCCWHSVIGSTALSKLKKKIILWLI